MLSLSFLKQKLIALRKRNLPEIPGCRILMYHSIDSTNYLEDKYGFYTISTERFRTQIKAMIDLGMKIVPIEEINPEMTNAVALTFDDGFKNNLINALPVLEDFNLKATVFVVSSFAQQSKAGYLSKQDIKDISRRFTIGGHGNTHTPLATLTKEAQRDEIMQSCRILSQFSGRELTMMSFPHGSFDQTTKNIAKECGISFCFTSEIDRLRKNFDHYAIPRIPILSSDSLQTFKDKITGKWDKPD